MNAMDRKIVEICDQDHGELSYIAEEIAKSELETLRMIQKLVKEGYLKALGAEFWYATVKGHDALQGKK